MGTKTELRELARRAPLGPWQKSDVDGWSVDRDGDGSTEWSAIKDSSGKVILLGVDYSEEIFGDLDTDPVREFVAAANPAVIISLLDELEASRDMATVGESLMQAIKAHADDGWHPANCPSEIVGDLRNQRDEAVAERDTLLKPCQDLIAYLDKNPPMGDSIWAVRQIREAVSVNLSSEVDQVQEQVEPVLPEDVVVGGNTFRKGVRLSTFITAAKAWHRVAYPETYDLTDEQRAANLARLLKCQPPLHVPPKNTGDARSPT